MCLLLSPQLSVCLSLPINSHCITLTKDEYIAVGDHGFTKWSRDHGFKYIRILPTEITAWRCGRRNLGKSMPTESATRETKLSMMKRKLPPLKIPPLQKPPDPVEIPRNHLLFPSVKERFSRPPNQFRHSFRP